MWGWLAVKWAIFVLDRANLSVKHRNLLTGHLLKSLNASPLNAILELNENGQIDSINGRPLDIEKIVQLREGAASALSNRTLSLIREQVQYESFVAAASKAHIPEDLLFYRAALWWGQRMEAYLKLLAQKDEVL